MTTNGTKLGAEQWLDQQMAELPVRIACAGCGETVGRYRPGRVAAPSLARPSVYYKCLRAGCRATTVVILDEVIV